MEKKKKRRKVDREAFYLPEELKKRFQPGDVVSVPKPAHDTLKKMKLNMTKGRVMSIYNGWALVAVILKRPGIQMVKGYQLSDLVRWNEV